MYEKPKKVKRSHPRDVPVPSKYCGIEGCNRQTVAYFKEHDVSRCASCYLQDLDNAGKSIIPLVARAMIDASSS